MATPLIHWRIPLLGVEPTDHVLQADHTQVLQLCIGECQPDGLWQHRLRIQDHGAYQPHGRPAPQPVGGSHVPGPDKIRLRHQRPNGAPADRREVGGLPGARVHSEGGAGRLGTQTGRTGQTFAARVALVDHSVREGNWRERAHHGRWVGRDGYVCAPGREDGVPALALPFQQEPGECAAHVRAAALGNTPEPGIRAGAGPAEERYGGDHKNSAKGRRDGIQDGEGARVCRLRFPEHRRAKQVYDFERAGVRH